MNAAIRDTLQKPSGPLSQQDLLTRITGEAGQDQLGRVTGLFILDQELPAFIKH